MAKREKKKLAAGVRVVRNVTSGKANALSDDEDDNNGEFDTGGSGTDDKKKPDAV